MSTPKRILGLHQEGGRVDIRETGKGGSKRELYAISAHFIESIWPQIMEWYNKNPNDFKNYIIANKTTEGLENDYQLAIKVEHFVTNALRVFVKGWREAMEKTADGNKEKENFNRYKNLLANKQNLIRTDDPENHILGGLRTATKTSLGVYAILPEIFKGKFKRPPSLEEMPKLLKGAKPVILSLARSTIGVFGTVRGAVYMEPDKPDQNASDHVSKFNCRSFDLNSLENLSLELDEKTLEELEQGYIFYDTWVGCPAVEAKTSSGSNVVAELSDWVAKLYMEAYNILNKQNA